MEFAEVADGVGRGADAAGIAGMVLGGLVATFLFLNGLRQGTEFPQAYRGYREGLGRAILLGLEFLVAADIIRTVAIAPTFSNVGILAIVVLIRTFLSITLQLEIEGRWPWQPR